MGILVFILAFFPKSNDRSMHIMRAEAPGPVIGKLVPRIQQSAMILYVMYMGLTLLCIVFLLAGGMPLFDTLCYTFGTAGTGGFSISSLGLGLYNSVYFEVVITVFMLLFGINFNLYYFLFLKNFKQIFKNEELRMYVFIVFSCIILITLNISHICMEAFWKAYAMLLFRWLRLFRQLVMRRPISTSGLCSQRESCCC